MISLQPRPCLPNMPEPAPALLLADCAGLCWPGPPGQTLDAALLLAARENAAAIGRAAPPPLAAGIAAALAGTPGAAARAFTNMFATADAAATAAPGWRGLRQLAGAPGIDFDALVLGRDAFVGGALYLPQLHALLHDGGHAPVHVAARDSLQLTWLDGMQLTIPRSWRRLPPGFAHPRLAALVDVDGIAVLNFIPELTSLASSFNPLPGAAVLPHLPVVSQGLALLRGVWPEAHDAVDRHLRALIILDRPSDHARSHSPADYPGLVMLTAGDPIEVADLLVHELSHVRMNAFRRFDAIDQRPDAANADALHASPWRSDPRPLRGLTDGVHAFLNVCEFHRRLAACTPDARIRAFALATFHRQAERVRIAWDKVRSAASPTRLGALLFHDLAAGVARL